MNEWEIKLHPDFYRDLNKLGTKILEIFHNKRKKIKKNPLRLKHLSGGGNCYREEITHNTRLIHYLEGKIIWFLTIGKHDKSYKEHVKRPHGLRA